MSTNKFNPVKNELPPISPGALVSFQDNRDTLTG